MIPFTKSTTIHLDCRDLYRRGLQDKQIIDIILCLPGFHLYSTPVQLPWLRVGRSDNGWDVHTSLTDPNDISNLAFQIDKALEAGLLAILEAGLLAILEAVNNVQPLDKSKEREEILTKVQVIIVEQLGVRLEDVQPVSRFVEDLGADSLDLVELVMAYEEEWWIDIEDEAAGKILTVWDAVRTIQGRLE